LSPKSDVVFKSIFGNIKYVKILISLLKADFQKRVAFYQSKMIAGQLKKGDGYHAMQKVVSKITGLDIGTISRL